MGCFRAAELTSRILTVQSGGEVPFLVDTSTPCENGIKCDEQNQGFKCKQKSFLHLIGNLNILEVLMSL